MLDARACLWEWRDPTLAISNTVTFCHPHSVVHVVKFSCLIGCVCEYYKYCSEFFSPAFASDSCVLIKISLYRTPVLEYNRYIIISVPLYCVTVFGTRDTAVFQQPTRWNKHADPQVLGVQVPKTHS